MAKVFRDVETRMKNANSEKRSWIPLPKGILNLSKIYDLRRGIKEYTRKDSNLQPLDS